MKCTGTPQTQISEGQGMDDDMMDHNGFLSSLGQSENGFCLWTDKVRCQGAHSNKQYPVEGPIARRLYQMINDWLQVFFFYHDECAQSFQIRLEEASSCCHATPNHVTLAHCLYFALLHGVVVYYKSRSITR